MIRQTIKIFFRSLKSNRLYYSINILGLIIGIASVFTILAYLINETSYNRYHKNSHDIYRVIANQRMAGDNYSSTRTMDEFAYQLKSKYPEVIKSTRTFDFTNYLGDVYIKRDNYYLKEKSFLLVDDDFVDIFTLPLLSGDFNSFKKSPNGIIITKKTANKHFGNKNPIGETIELKNNSDNIVLTISAVIEDYSNNSTIQTGLIGKIGPIYKGLLNKQMIANYQTYLLLKSGINPGLFENKLPKEGDNIFNTSYVLQNIKDIYLHSAHLKDSPPEITGNMKNLYIFSIISFLILLVACGNYIILSNICFMTRNKEIAIKKTHGLSTKNVFISFLGESVFLTLLSFPFAIVLSLFLISIVGQIFDIQLSPILFLNWRFLCGAIIILIITGVLGGSYNAFYLSSLKPVRLLNNNFLQGQKKYYFSKSLIIFQTVTFVILLFCISIIYKQTNYGLNIDIGFNKENLIALNGTDSLFKKNYAFLKNNLRNNRRIQNYSGASSGLFNKPELVLCPNKANEHGFTSFNVFAVDYNYFETAGFKILSGRSFSEEFHPELNKIVINEKAAEEFDLVNPIGEKIDGKEIIGVVKDFNISSLKENIPPVMFVYSGTENISQVLISTDNLDNIDSYIENLMSSSGLNSSVDLVHINDNVKAMYKGENQFVALVTIFTVLLIIISSMGLFGLSAFLNNQKTKEIAIRKTFGANLKEILSHLLKDYFVILIVSNVIGLPIAFHLMKIWLANYSYQIEIKMSIFITVVIVSSAIIAFAVIYNILKTSNQSVLVQLKRE